MVRIKIRRKHNKKVGVNQKTSVGEERERLKERRTLQQKLDYSPSQLEMLNQFHRELDNIRNQILQLKTIKAQLEKAISEKKPITHTQLLQYCNNLSMASKGKLNPKKR